MLQLLETQSRHLSTRTSENFVGYSPMAPSAPIGAPIEGKIPTAREVEISGGVWAPTSAKRDKLTELKGELPEGKEDLTAMATEEQMLDLYLADGLEAIVKASKESEIETTTMELLDWLESTANDLPEDLAQVQFETFLGSIASKIDSSFQSIPKDRYVKEVRDFMEPPQEEGDVGAFLAANKEGGETMNAFKGCILRYRLHTIKAAAEHLKENWEKLTTVTDGDMDRAAVKGETIEPRASTLSRDAIKNVIVEFAKGDDASRFAALWKLIDRDQDGLLDSTEMKQVAYFTVTPVGKALQQLFEEVLEARPVREPLLLEVEDETEEEKTPAKLGFRARRKEKSVLKRLKRHIGRGVTNHFEDEVEMPHRLRCIYSWSEKVHQGNRIDSIQIDTGLGGRKRYVELQPKIALPEFLEVQMEHFKQLDRVGEEFVKSFREDLWCDQGRGRQRNELYWNTTYFMGVVCVIDVGIYFL
jgi:hypothetical protein